MIACFKIFIRNLLNYYACLSVIVPLILFSGCEEDPESNNPDSYLTSIQLISARQITLTSYEVILSTEVGEKISKAELIFDDITILTSSNIIFNIGFPENGKRVDTVSYDLKRINHDFLVKARLILEEDTVYSNEIVVRTVKNTYNIALLKDDLYYDPGKNIGLSINKDESFSVIIEFNNLYVPQSTELKLNRTISLRHSIDFNNSALVYTAEGPEVYGRGYLDNNVPAGIYEVYLYIDGIEFKADSKIQVLEGEWSLVNSDYPGDKLYEYSSFVLGDNLYITGGTMAGSFQLINKVWNYSFTTNKWQRKNNFPAENVVISQSSMKHNGKGYVILRNNNKNNANELWEYNNLIDEWKLTTTYPGTGNDLTYFIIKDKLYAGGGRQFINEVETRYRDFWSYDLISKEWEKLNDLPFINPVQITLSCSSDDYGFVYIFDNSFWAYDPANDSWALKAEFPGPSRSHGNIGCLNNRVYLIGSMYYDAPVKCGLKDCWEYDTESDQWKLNSFVPSYANTGFVNTYNNSLITGVGFAPVGWIDVYEPYLYIMTP